MKLPVCTSEVSELALTKPPWALENEVCGFYGIVTPAQGKGGAER